jgi:hypothetical protein
MSGYFIAAEDSKPCITEHPDKHRLQPVSFHRSVAPPAPHVTVLRSIPFLSFPDLPFDKGGFSLSASSKFSQWHNQKTQRRIKRDTFDSPLVDSGTDPGFLEAIPGIGSEFLVVRLIPFLHSFTTIDKSLPCSFVVLESSERCFHASSRTILRTCFGHSATTGQNDTKANNTNAIFKIHLKFSSIKYLPWLGGYTRFLNRSALVRPHEPNGIILPESSLS